MKFKLELVHYETCAVGERAVGFLMKNLLVSYISFFIPFLSCFFFFYSYFLPLHLFIKIVAILFSGVTLI